MLFRRGCLASLFGVSERSVSAAYTLDEEFNVGNAKPQPILFPEPKRFHFKITKR